MICRKQDVMETDVDKVQIYKCFRPGDIVLASVVKNQKIKKTLSCFLSLSLWPKNFNYILFMIVFRNCQQTC